MKAKNILIILAIIFIGGSLGYFYWKNLRGIWPAVGPPAGDITRVINTTGMPLTLPDNFSIEIFASDLPAARVMKFDALGNLWVSQTREGKIALLEIKNGEVVNKIDIFTNLKKPHGLAFDPDNPFMLYIAEEDKISRVRVYSEGELEKIADLPCCGGHFTRTLGFGPDKKLYVSIGSSCNVCEERDSRRAKIFRMDKDGGNFEEFAAGLRNTVFFTWHPKTGKMWGTDMGRDLIGDDIPPDEINIIEADKNYGWPICYGKNVLDTDFHGRVHEHIRAHCEEPFEMPSHIDIQAHSAPLGLAFFPTEGWPKEFHNDLLVSYHGSWNRTVPTGYKIVRFKLDETGKYLSHEDFVTGWLTEPKPAEPKDEVVINVGQSYGRPVDILIQPGGIIYISDDKTGVIYRVIYQN